MAGERGRYGILVGLEVIDDASYLRRSRMPQTQRRRARERREIPGTVLAPVRYASD